MYFTIDEVSNLLNVVNYYTMRMQLCKEDGTVIYTTTYRYFDSLHENAECFIWYNLEPGTYYILFSNWNVPSITYEEQFRLQKIDENKS